MALKYAPRVKETTTTEGDIAYELGGAVQGFQSFYDGIGYSDTFYCCTNGTDWEVGSGRMGGGSPYTLTRLQVAASTNNGGPVNWGAGEKDIFCALPYHLLNAIQGGKYGIFAESYDGETDVEGYRTISIGGGNTISGTNSENVLIAGNDCYVGPNAQATYAIGSSAYSRKDRSIVFSTGAQFVTGDTQQTLANRSRTTYDGATVGIFGSDLSPANGTDCTIAYTVDVVARQTDGTAGTVGDSKWIRIEFLVKYIADTGTLSLVGSAVPTMLAQDAGAALWTATVDLAETEAIRATGETDKVILWMASIKGVEVGYTALPPG